MTFEEEDGIFKGGLSLNLELIFQEQKVKPPERGFSPTGTLLLKDGLKIKNYIQSPGKECKYVVKSPDDLVVTLKKSSVA